MIFDFKLFDVRFGRTELQRRHGTLLLVTQARVDEVPNLLLRVSWPRALRKLACSRSVSG
jgi:hypothetical protein